MVSGRDGRLLADGERVLLIDAKERRYLVTLRSGVQFHTHAGIVDHDDLIGVDEGATITGSTGRRFLVLRPTLADVVLKMPRGAQVIYPKDLAAILMEADVAPGVRVLEAGVGSGALSMALLRGGADVVGYELRDDFAERATCQCGQRPRCRGVLPDRAARRLRRHRRTRPRPSRPRSARALARPAPRPGCAPARGHPVRLPALHQPDDRAARRPAPAPLRAGRTIEVLHRSWHIEHRSVRPDHRMVGHTGFITSARLLLEDEAVDGKRDV